MPVQPSKKAGASPSPLSAKTISTANDKVEGLSKWGPIAIIAIAALVYINALSNGFTNYDDDFYILNNLYIKDFSFAGIKAIFTSFYMANYHPLTTLTFWFEYHFFGINPLPYHLVNVLLHLANTWLVYKVVMQLSGKNITALFTALFFAIHPMHVESVAWISERKDVLYAFFYLLAIHYYLVFISNEAEKGLYMKCLLFFLLSLLSKSAAVTLPVLLITIDLYKGRKMTASVLLEKIPFLLLALTFGVLAVMSQKEGGALRNLSETHSLIDRVFLLAYGLLSYLYRLLLPLNLSAMHNYPVIKGQYLPWFCYASLPVVIIVGWLAARQSRYKREILFGAVFFLVTISVMSQIVAVGSAIIAERYTYIPYIGLFYIGGQYFADLLETKHKSFGMGALVCLGIVFCIVTWNRIAVWKDGEVLFTDVIDKNPDYYFGYWMRGNLNNGYGKKDAAIADYSQAIKFAPQFQDLYYDRAHAYFDMGNLQSAISDYSSAININPKLAEAYNDRGWAYYKAGNKDAGLADINKSLQLTPKFAEAYNNRGSIAYEAGNIDAALPDFSKAIELKPDYELPYLNRAAIFANTKNFKAALDDYDKLIRINPENNNAFFNRGLVKLNLNDRQGACQDLGRAQELGNPDAAGLLEKFCR